MANMLTILVTFTNDWSETENQSLTNDYSSDALLIIDVTLNGIVSLWPTKMLYKFIFYLNSISCEQTNILLKHPINTEGHRQLIC